ncbi:MAG: caspase family protein [Magnetococcales bacterium]|nr:caspase family protein [Magnetococcales bacterium]
MILVDFLKSGSTKRAVNNIFTATLIVFLTTSHANAFDVMDDIVADYAVNRQFNIRQKAGIVIKAIPNGDDNAVALHMKSGEIRVWEFNNGMQNRLTKSQSGGSGTLSIPTLYGTEALLFKSSGKIAVSDLFSGSETKTSEKLKSNTTALAGSPVRPVFAFGDKNGNVGVWDLEKKDTVWSKKHHSSSIRSLYFSHDGRFLFSTGSRGSVIVSDAENGKQLHKLPEVKGRINKIRFFQTADGRPALAVASDKGIVTAWSLSAKKTKVKDRGIIVKQKTSVDNVTQLWSRKAASRSITALSGVPKGSTKIAVGDEKGNITILDVKSGKKVTTFKSHDGQVLWLRLAHHGQMVVSAGADSELHIRDSSSGKRSVLGVSTKNGWVALDTRGRFDGSDNAMADVSWVVDTLDLDLDNFSNTFFEPGLLVKYVSEDIKFATKGLFDIAKALPLPPTIKKLSFLKPGRDAGQPAHVVVAARNIRSSIERIELFHNGKRVPKSKVIVDKEQKKGDDVFVRAAVYEVDPVPGENSFRAVGVGTGGIEGPSKIISDEFKGTAEDQRLHVMTVGINQYKIARLNLRYAVPDSQAVTNYFRNFAEDFSDVRISNTHNNQATRKNIIKKLKALAAETNPSDTLVLYLAGHGLVANGDWYFIPYDLPETTSSSIVKSAISATQLREILIEAKAQKVMLFIDACQSGKTVSPFQTFLMRRIHRSIGRSSGVGVLTASRSNQNALEMDLLGHGLFTSSVLDGFSGNADIKPHNKRVSAHEIMDFTKKRIPSLAQKYLKERQVPVSFSSGIDFNLGAVSNQ